MSRWLFRAPIILLLVLASTSFMSALTAANSVPSTRVGNPTDTLTAEKVKPSTCASITLTTGAIGSGSFSGTGASELVLGSATPDTIDARGGNDCVLGGGSNDSITGGSGTDVCIGGPGTDTFSGCETPIQ